METGTERSREREWNRKGMGKAFDKFCNLPKHKLWGRHFTIYPNLSSSTSFLKTLCHSIIKNTKEGLLSKFCN